MFDKPALAYAAIATCGPRPADEENIGATLREVRSRAGGRRRAAVVEALYRAVKLRDWGLKSAQLTPTGLTWILTATRDRARLAVASG